MKKLPLIALSTGMYNVIYLVICGIFTSKLEILEEGNDVLNAEHLVERLLCCNLPEGAFYMLVRLEFLQKSYISAACWNFLDRFRRDLVKNM